MTSRTVEAVLRLSSKLGSMAAFGKLSENLTRVEGQARRFNREQGLIGEGARAMHTTLMRYAAPGALTYGASQAISDFAEIERRMTRIGITAGVTGEATNAAFQQMQGYANDYAMPLDQVVAGLDTLVSSGRSMEEALSFLPAVLRTAQASGAATEDIANTAEKASSALGLSAADMQRAFDIMIEGGKAGQFELRDMAAYVPELANSFASLGYQGEEGLKQLVAVLQTIREDTGSASAAATQAQNVFGKMYSEETANKFADFGIDLRQELEAAREAGEGAVQAFVRISREAVAGDLSKLPLLFTDQEFRLGMQSLMTSADSYERFIEAVNNSRVDGAAQRDLNRVLDDTQARIDRAKSAWSEMTTTFGGAIAPPVTGVMQGMTEEVRKGQAINKALDEAGMSEWDQGIWRATSNFFPSRRDGMAWRGGYRSDEQRRMIEMHAAHAKSRLDGAGPMDVPPVPVLLDAVTGEAGAITPRRSAPASRHRPFAAGSSPRDAERASMDALARNPNEVADAINDALEQSSRRAATALADAGDAVQSGGERAGSAMERGATAIERAAASIAGAANGMREANRWNNWPRIGGYAILDLRISIPKEAVELFNGAGRRRRRGGSCRRPRDINCQGSHNQRMPLHRGHECERNHVAKPRVS